MTQQVDQGEQNSILLPVGQDDEKFISVQHTSQSMIDLFQLYHTVVGDFHLVCAHHAITIHLSSFVSYQQAMSLLQFVQNMQRLTVHTNTQSPFRSMYSQ